ncbi:MAG: (E)-4-hydroxy-3-methylbut-2-enyl-diphosphate synthase [Paludibacteraceae bacterium]|nr:(E)-4-hydroxy-3-methylbut-2-enyl-diphosphate synthase [Paludibacteraceae bacterium]MBQ6962550.1 (E)-4-hydroxy-3-methylbut-2-enyl-diphosphate synthase [Paludibacteraceae bacterium]MBQ7748854.1 (E)-4-hydroxy-3-methylbut-2-enyl-diphosphate synthase [Paludibacteraceae bacterium]
MDLFNYKRRTTREVTIGGVALGGGNEIRLQSMTNTNTLDTDGSVAQIKRIADAGGDLVRLTAQGVKEAENLENIHEKLRSEGYTTPLVADIHFNPKAAEEAAKHVEKVRINPGNFSKNPEETEEKLKKLIDICNEHKTALRIGVNHGSLAQHVMDKYGDTPQGMAESAMEYLRLCHKLGFDNVVVSMKASNTMVMVESVRILCAMMMDEGMNYPLHLGVTEAGNGEDGRIKSAAGIGALLADGIGDTIRVSLSEAPEKEIPVAKKLADYFKERETADGISANDCGKFNPFSYSRRKTTAVRNIGGENVPVVITNCGDTFAEPQPDYTSIKQMKEAGVNAIETDLKSALSCWDALCTEARKENSVIIINSTGKNSTGEYRAIIHRLESENIAAPVILKKTYNEDELESLQVKAAADMGVMFIDGMADGIMIENASEKIAPEDVKNLSFGILQATRARITKTEYISCPGCGRTLYDLENTITQIKERTKHLKGLKIGIMGCIVNGPGEMADADYGYVGAGVGKVSLYKRKECVEKNIPTDQAVDKLIALIKSNGDWKE